MKVAVLSIYVDMLPSIIRPITDCRDLKIIGSQDSHIDNVVNLIVTGNILPDECEVPKEGFIDFKDIRIDFHTERYGDQTLTRVEKVTLADVR